LVLAAATLAAARLATAWVLWRGGPWIDHRVARVFAVVLLVEALTMVNRAWTGWSGELPSIGSDAQLASVHTWIAMLSSALLCTPLLMLLGLGRMIGNLRDSASRLRATLNAMPDALFELDAQRRLLQVRSRRAEQLPFPRDSPVGAPLDELVPAPMYQALTELLDRAGRGGDQARIRLPDERDGQTHWFEFCAAAQRPGATGQGFVIVCRDVTDHEQAERSLRQRNDLLQHLVALSPIGMLLSELDSGRIREANPAFLAQSGHTAEQISRIRYAELFADSDAWSTLSMTLRAEGRCAPLDLEWKRSDGEVQPVRLSALVALDPDGVRLVWSLVEDVAEQHRVQRAKTELVAVVSHELRTPLTALMGAVALLAGISGDALDQRSRQLLEVALGNGHRLRQLVDDLLDLDRLVAGKLRFVVERQRLSALLQSALANNQTYGAERGIRLRLDSPNTGSDCEVEVDGQRLVQVLGNLLSNAIKFSPADGVVVLSAECAEGMAVISVCDQGPGVPENFLPQLFERFSQADASDSRERGGSGLGLAIAREMVERMQGRIEYRRVAGGGACFRILLPLA
jgi:PAS domain S-box-containing protein